MTSRRIEAPRGATLPFPPQSGAAPLKAMRGRNGTVEEMRKAAGDTSRFRQMLAEYRHQGVRLAVLAALARHQQVAQPR